MSREKPMGTINIERSIAAPPEAVFDAVTDSANLRLASLVLRVKQVQEGRSGGWSAGAVREVTAAGAWFREELTTVERPHTFGYQILKSVPPITHFGGTITVTPYGAGSLVVWQSTFDIPLFAGGAVTAAVLEPVLTFGFRQILAKADAQLTA